MLKKDDIMVLAKLLIMGDIDKKIRIAGIQVVEGNAFQRFHGLPQGRVDGRPLERRMAK